DVPRERAPELRPNPHRARIWNQPIREPGAAKMQYRKQAGLEEREEGHRLGESIDARTPLLLEEQQERRDERPGVADSDPPNEIRDGEGPRHRNVVSEGADAREKDIKDANEELERDEPRDDDAGLQPLRRFEDEVREL